MAFRISDRNANASDRKGLSRRTKVDLLCFAVIILVATFFALRDDSAEVLNWNDTELVLTMSEDMVYTVPYGEITGVTLVEDPEFGVCLSGGDTAKSQYGVWRNEALGDYVLYAYRDASPVIQISTAQEDYWIAVEKSEMTTAFYEAFLKMLNEAGYEIQ